jgi:hypothetical protein
MLERRLHVRRSYVRGEMDEPKSPARRRTIGYGLTRPIPPWAGPDASSSSS